MGAAQGRIVVVVAVVAALTGCASAATSPDGGAAATAQGPGVTDPSGRTEAGIYAVTEAGVRAGPADAPVEVVVYQDMQCPYCAELHSHLHGDVTAWAESGDVSIEFRTIAKLARDDPDTFSSIAGNVAAAVAAEDAGAWGAVQEALYAAQGGPADVALLVDVARDADAELSVEAVRRIEDRAFDDTLAVAFELAQDEGVPYVPYVLVDGLGIDGAADTAGTAAMVRDAVAAAVARSG